MIRQTVPYGIIRGGSRWGRWLVTPLARQPISCYYYVCDLSYFDVVLCPSSSLILAISFSRKPRPPQCSLARVPKVCTPSKKIRDPPMVITRLVKIILHYTVCTNHHPCMPVPWPHETRPFHSPRGQRVHYTRTPGVGSQLFVLVLSSQVYMRDGLFPALYDRRR